MSTDPKIRRVSLAASLAFSVALAACDPGPPVFVQLFRDAPTSEPTAGAIVMYADRHGNHVGTVRSDADGLATISGMPRGGFVTVAYPEDVFPGSSPFPGRALYTVAGVEPGDELRVGRRPRGLALGTLRIFVEDPNRWGRMYRVIVQCGAGSFYSAELPASVEIELFESCVPQSGELLVLGEAEVSGRVIAFASARVQLSDVDGTIEAHALLNRWTDAGQRAQIEYENVDEPVGRAVVALFGVRGERSYLLDSDYRASLETGERVWLDTPVPSGLFERLQVATERIVGYAINERLDIFSGDAALPPTSFRLSALLPIPDEPTADPARRTAKLGFSSTPTCGDAPAKAVLVTLHGSDPLSSSFYPSHRWKMLAAYSATIAFPALDPVLSEELWPTDLDAGPDMHLTLFADSSFDYSKYKQQDVDALSAFDMSRAAPGRATFCETDYGPILKGPPRDY